MIGDRWRDIEAGRRAGCLTIRLEQPYAQGDPESAPDYQTRSLPDAASWILARCAPAGGIPMRPVSELRVKLFADGADLQGMREMARQPWIKGFTTNPTLMRKA